MQSNFPQTCQQCHTTTTWGNATFDHSTTGFPLTGAHTSLQCMQCHVNGNYNLTGREHGLCQLPPRTISQDQQSAARGGWIPADLHDSAIARPTLDVCNVRSRDHRVRADRRCIHRCTCAQCHTNNNYKLTSGACAQCHLTDFQGTANPNHVQAGFPRLCDQCHTTTNWGSGTFDHATTGLHVDGRAYLAAVQPVPRERQLRPD